MTEKGKRILDLFEKIVSDLSEVEMEKLLAFGEGVVFMASQHKQQPTTKSRNQLEKRRKAWKKNL